MPLVNFNLCFNMARKILSGLLFSPLGLAYWALGADFLEVKWIDMESGER